MVEQVTQGIKIGVKTKYNGTSYRNYRLYHIFSYFVTITNNSNHKVQLKSRRWTILDSQNKTGNVEGEGVVGDDRRALRFEGADEASRVQVAVAVDEATACAGVDQSVAVPVEAGVSRDLAAVEHVIPVAVKSR